MINQIKRPYFLTFRNYIDWSEYPKEYHTVIIQREGDSTEELKEWGFKLWSSFNKVYPHELHGCLIQENFLPDGDIRNHVGCYTQPREFPDGLKWHDEGYYEWITGCRV